VYGAGERPIAGVSPELIAERIRSLGVSARMFEMADVEGYLAATAAPGDLLITLVAGDVWRVAAALGARAAAQEAVRAGTPPGAPAAPRA